ncbi:MAG: prepilin-type N-terminal cleavage/methylation domain-containing protein [Candidatus Peribacteria bacterium]|jgi:prepilin-type N-terminal cleavage/methylation domain-containing protein|nr:prepilin-type N-terminal cleavage/methylation domain-containing protein [Candidatus Peribacteria bacterium]
MKKANFKAFTLVEMLIVIVIIGILIAALLPRLQGAQGMARDTARQTALSQLQAAIVTYQSLNGRRPGSGEATISPVGGINTNTMTKLVTSNIMSELPVDPNLDNTRTGVGAVPIT